MEQDVVCTESWRYDGYEILSLATSRMFKMNIVISRNQHQHFLSDTWDTLRKDFNFSSEQQVFTSKHDIDKAWLWESDNTV